MKAKAWNAKFRVEWYSSLELRRFAKWLRLRIGRRSKPLHEDVRELARIDTELERRAVSKDTP
jgi:hypothetical protein